MANIKLFDWDTNTNSLHLRTEELFLIPEFKNILDLDKEQGEGTAWKFFTYIYLAFDNLSPYGELVEQDRLNTAYEESGLTQDQVTHGIMQAACIKYMTIQDNRVVRMLKAAQELVEKMTDNLRSIDLDERTNSGGLVHKGTDIIKQINQLADIHDGLTKLEFQVRQERDKSKGNRGDNEEGYNN